MQFVKTSRCPAERARRAEQIRARRRLRLAVEQRPELEETPSAVVAKRKQRMERALSTLTVVANCNLDLLDAHTICTADFPPKTSSRGRAAARDLPPRVLQLVRLAPRSSSIVKVQPEVAQLEVTCAEEQPLVAPVLDRVQPLTAEETKQVQCASTLTTHVRIDGPGRCLAYEMHGKDFATLVDSAAGLLDDSVINAYVALLNARNMSFFSCTSEVTSSKVSVDPVRHQEERSRQHNSTELYEGGRQRTYTFGCYFFSLLSRTRAAYDFQRVRNWTTGPRATAHDGARKVLSNKVCILDYSRVLVPVNLSNTHWILAAVDIKNKQFVYLDSLSCADRRGVIPTLRRWFVDEVVDKYGTSVSTSMDISNWRTVLNPPYVPRQTDGVSCGMFMMQLAHDMELGRRPDFNQDDIPLLRKRAALALYRGKLATP